MQTSSRLYQCGRCHTPVIICRICDRGQRYCLNGCRQKARKTSLQRASKKYQSSRAGRFNNAARQKNFRQRKKQSAVKVTHHGSLEITCHVVLKTKQKRVEQSQKLPQSNSSLACHHCGAGCGYVLRNNFLRRT